MSKFTKVLTVNNLKLPLNASYLEAFSVAKKKLKNLGLNASDFTYSIAKRSVDARKKDDISFVYSVAVSGDIPHISEDKLKKFNITQHNMQDTVRFTVGEQPMFAPPLVVGSGPCGLFCALLLAEHGYRPIVIERGGSVMERKEAVNKFNSLSILDTNTNIQFGAGGAGTFSDGKLITRINDKYAIYILQRFVEFGAPQEILYLAKPHIGTDILSLVVEKMLARIEELGGTVVYHTQYLYSKKQNGMTVAVTDRGDLEYGALVLAIGHSARDTYAKLQDMNFAIEPKSFSVGMRIEHRAEKIDEAMYGKFAGMKELGHAEYSLSYNTKERGVYTFCMCPGGMVVASTSEENGCVVNGMSEHARLGDNSNCAVVCSIFPTDYGNTPQGAINFQRTIERRAFLSGGGDYGAPIITVGDFLSDVCKNEPADVKPTYMDGKRVKLSRPENYLPKLVTDSIKNALYDFDKKINGFASETAVLTGAETRTSSPIRIIRDNDTRLALGFENIYPAGEGAGYAGGITSAAIDGVKTAGTIINKYKPHNQ